MRLGDLDALRETLEGLHPGYALSQEEEGRCNNLRDVLAILDAAPTVDVKWWWRDREVGTMCIYCHGKTHYDAGIDDIPHQDGCPFERREP